MPCLRLRKHVLDKREESTSVVVGHFFFSLVSKKSERNSSQELSPFIHLAWGGFNLLENSIHCVEFGVEHRAWIDAFVVEELKMLFHR